MDVSNALYVVVHSRLKFVFLLRVGIYSITLVAHQVIYNVRQNTVLTSRMDNRYIEKYACSIKQTIIVYH